MFLYNIVGTPVLWYVLYLSPVMFIATTALLLMQLKVIQCYFFLYKNGFQSCREPNKKDELIRTCSMSHNSASSSYLDNIQHLQCLVVTA